MINYRYDRTADALEIRLGEGPVARTEQVDDGTLVDLDQDGHVIAIEVIQPSRRWPLTEIIDRFSLDDEQAAILRSHWEGAGRHPFTEPAEVGAGANAGELIIA